MKTSANEKIKPHNRRIDRHYHWRTPTVVDRHPELIAYLDTNPKYVDALYFRRLLVKRLKHYNEPTGNRQKWDLINAVPEPHLKLVKELE